MKPIYLLLSSIFYCFLLSCEKGGPSYFYINNNEVKQSCSFKKGSYFIYKDSVTGSIDSFWIYDSYVNLLDINSTTHTGDALFIEQAGYLLMNNDSIKGKVHTGACYKNGSGCNENVIYAEIGINYPYSNSIESYGNNFYLGQKNQEKNGYSIYQHYYDSILLNGNFHYKVYQVFHKGVYALTPMDSIAYTTFYSLSEGVVKYSIKSDTSYHSWELVNNHIIQ